MTAPEEAKSKPDDEIYSDAKSDSAVSETVGVAISNVESAPETPRPMPGLELLGRGIYLKPRQPYELKQRILKPQRTEAGRTVYCADVGKSYFVPDEFVVNHSPPMPVGQTLNQTVIEQSWESLESHFEVNANVAAGVAAFSVKANNSQIVQLRSSEEAYYALRTSFIPAWTVDLIEQPDVTALRRSLKKVSDQIEAVPRKIALEALGEELIWMYDIQTLLSKRSQEPDNTYLAKLRDEISKMVPKALVKVIPSPLEVEHFDALLKAFGIDKEGEIDRTKFERSCRGQYETFFQQFGTHFVKRVWVGGTATLAFTINKSGVKDLKEIQAGINATYGGLGAGTATNQKNTRAKLEENSTCSVWGKGGDESKLAGLNTLDQGNYNGWLESVKTNPQVIEMEVVGIWSLLRDKSTNELTAEATALLEAYREIYEFAPIAAVFSCLGDAVYFIKSTPPQRVDRYEPQHKADFQMWEKLKDVPLFSNIPFDRIDAAFAGTNLPSRNDGEIETEQSKLFLFRRDEYVCMDFSRPQNPAFQPTPVKDGWPGVEFNTIDAVLNAGPDSIYFFRGDEYIRFNWAKQKADFEPRKFCRHWDGVTFDRIDAAIYWGNGKAYFFRGDRYIVYDMNTYRADPGYPKYLPGLSDPLIFRR